MFDSSKQYVVSTDSVLPSLDGSQLYNIRPASARIAFTNSGSDHILWNVAGTSATVSHSLNCYPVVTVWDATGLQVFPNITVLSATSFRMDFEYAVSIDPESPWYCIVNYGGEYGDGTDDGQELEPSSSSSSSDSPSGSALPPIIGNSDPTTATEGVPGQIYYNESSDRAFLCIRLASGETQGEILYIWREIGGADSGGSSGGGGGSWGSITGTLANQTDLANALAGKQNTIDASHMLSYSYLSGAPDMADYVAKTEKGAANGVPQLDSNTLVPRINLPKAGMYGGAGLGAVTWLSTYGIDGDSNSGIIKTVKATNAQIDVRSYNYQPIVPSNLDYAVRSVLPNVTVIPAATTAYTLLDASATTNSHSCKYRHAPTSAPTYTLPDVTDDTVEHEITLDVDCSEVTSLVFEDEDGNILSLQDDIEINYGDKWRFMCSYAYGIWMVFPMRMNVGIITAAPNISITGTAGSALTLTALPVVSSDAETVTFGTATGLPSGVSVSEAGFVSGTPAAAGTYDCTVKAYAKYSRPVDVQFQIVVS